MIEQAVILAGGRGSRLGELTKKIPKPVISVSGEPFVGHLLSNLSRHGIHNVIFSVGYLSKKIFEIIGDGSKYGVKIRYVKEPQPLGTGGGLKNCYELLREIFLVLNGDSLFDINYLDLALGLKEGALGILALRQVENRGRYGSVEISGDSVSCFSEKSREGLGLISGGVYAFTRKCIADFPDGFFSLEKDLFTKVARTGLLKGRIYDGFFIDIGTPIDLMKAEKEISRWKKKEAVFFLRERIIKYCSGFEDGNRRFQLQEGALEALKFANDNGLLAILVINQNDLGFPLHRDDIVGQFTKWMQEELGGYGGHFDDILYCSFRPGEFIGTSRPFCSCNNEANDMLLSFIKRWNIDLNRSFVEGIE
jgi:dTDP-glucose pyrophosphorylase